MKWLMYLKFLCLAALAGFLIYCGTQPAPQNQGIGRSESDYDALNKRRAAERAEALKESGKNYTGPKCLGDDDCEDICRDIYRHSVRDDCEDLAIEQVEILEKIDKIFENPKERDLKDIDAYDFETYVNIDLGPFDKRVGKFSLAEAKRVLAWIVENQDILETFKNVDDEYNLFEDMLNDLSSGSKTAALRKSVSGSDSLIEIALDKEEDVLVWLHEYFAEDCSSGSEEEEVCIFQTWYCKLNLSKDGWDALVDYQSFEDDIANTILSRYKCGSCSNVTDAKPGGTTIPWWTDDVEEVRQIPGNPNDLQDLCLDNTLEQK